MYFYFNWADVKFKFKFEVTTSKFIKFHNSNFPIYDKPDYCDTNLDKNDIRKNQGFRKVLAIQVMQNNFTRRN